MDLIANIEEQRRAAHDLIQALDNGWAPLDADIRSLAECVIALDEWRKKGGADPDAVIAAELVDACKTALSAFRNMYEQIDDGADIEDIRDDESLWPLAKLRQTLERAGVSEDEIAAL